MEGSSGLVRARMLVRLIFSFYGVLYVGFIANTPVDRLQNRGLEQRNKGLLLF